MFSENSGIKSKKSQWKLVNKEVTMEIRKNF